MKRIITLALTFVLLFSLAAKAQQEAPQPLTLAEIEQFNAELLARAIREDLTPVPAEGGFLARGESYELLLSSEDLSGDSVVLSAALVRGGHGEEALPGPRGLRLETPAEEALTLFPNDNPFLAGTPDSAALYVAGELPAAVHLGFLLREGQKLTLAEYGVLYQADEGVSRAGVQLTFEQGLLSAVRSYVSAGSMGQEEARETLDALRALQEETAYIAYGSQEGTRLTREDLVLAGLDFVDLTRETALNALGAAANEETADNGGGSLVTMQWPGVEAVFIVEGGNEKAQRLTVREGLLEGPRGLRIGDSLAQAISRFDHGEDLPVQGGALYGDAAGQKPPFGALVAGADGTTLYYAVETDKGSAALMLEFIQDSLVSMTMTYL